MNKIHFERLHHSFSSLIVFLDITQKLNPQIDFIKQPQQCLTELHVCKL